MVNTYRIRSFSWAGVAAGVFVLAAGLWPLDLPAAGEGTTAAPFLKIGTSSRAEGMGGAYTAVVDDVDATYFNPAGLTQLQRSTVGFTHMEWFEGIRYEYVSYADKYDYIGAVGVSLGYLYLGDIPQTYETVSGDYDDVNSGGTFGASDLAIGLAWAGNLFMRENKIGVGLKVIQEAIADSQSFSVGIDVGDQILLSRTRWYRKALKGGDWTIKLVPSTVGLAFKNLGTPVKYSFQSDPLPSSAHAGVAYKFLEDDLTAALDLEYRLTEGLAVVHLGGEYWIHTGMRTGPEQTLDVAVRAGYRTGYGETSAPGVSFGLGVVYSALGMDYVFMPFGDLGSTHRISLKFSWGDILKDKIIVKRRKVVERELSPSERALQKTAKEMVRAKEGMEGKVVVKKKARTDKRELTGVEAKRPEREEVAKETESHGADIRVKSSAKGAPTPVIQRGRSTISTDALVAKIAKGAQQDSATSRTRSRYTKRTRADVIRAARQEAQRKGQAFDEVEAAAKAEAARGGRKLVTRTTVYFAQNRDALNDKYLPALDQIARTFDVYPTRTILVHGFASASEKEPNGLSRRRAKTVKDYLVQIKSIPSNKISLQGFGTKKPAAKENTAKGRALNRRVRVQIIDSGN